MFTHRSVQNEDLYSICALPQSKEELFYIGPKFTYPLTPEQILDALKERVEPTVVLEEKTNEVAAYANIYGYDSEALIGWLGNVIVSPKYRGQGAAIYLLNVMLDKAKYNLGIKTINLACHNTNSRGLAFYSKIGFKPFDIKLTNIEGRKIIAIHMSKELN